MDKPISQSLEIVIPAFRMHTQMFDNIIDGIREDDALRRVEGRTNHIVWMAGNLVNCRYWLSDVLGMKDKDPNEALFGNAKALDDSLPYPALSVLKEQWHKISPEIYKGLLLMSQEQLQSDYEFGMGIDFIQENKMNMVGMALDRQSYLFGQIGLMRRILGYEGVRYDINKALNY